MEGVDYAFSAPNEKALRAAGKLFAGRYVGPGTSDKHLNAAERDRIFAAGMSIFLNAEGTSGGALAGHDMGVTHATLARRDARALGAPDSVPIYFAVDFDVTTGAQWPRVAAYLRGAASVIGVSHVGVYGGYNAMVWAHHDGVAAWFFQTYAWSGGRWFPGNHIEQYHNGVPLAGGDVDLCRAKQPNYGQWSTLGGGDVNLTDKLSNGYTIDNALVTLLARTPVDVARRFDAVLAAASADPASTVTMSDADRAALAAALLAAVHMPTPEEIAKAVNDDEAARLTA